MQNRILLATLFLVVCTLALPALAVETSLGSATIGSGALGTGLDLKRAKIGLQQRVPANRRDPEDSASAGASKPRMMATDLGLHAEKEEDAISKNKQGR
jgi:hypothetical protein